MTRDDRWMAELWAFTEPALPPAPAVVVEIGCGPSGGLVPALRAAGYDAVGVDPEAPEGPHHRRCEFEQYPLPEPVDAFVASTSLHHVADLDLVLDRMATAVRPGGAVVIAEWAWERFDEATAKWCFGHVNNDNTTWLQHAREEFAESGQPWDAFRRAWAEEAGLHTGERILDGLDARFRRLSCAYGPYFFPDLDGVSAADEKAAIDSGQIRALGIRYTATRLAGTRDGGTGEDHRGDDREPAQRRGQSERLRG